MAFELDNVKTDATAEVEGVWTDVVAGLRVRIARLGNPGYLHYIRQETQRRTAHGVQELEATDAIDIGIRAMARFILLDWENLQEGGVELEYSVETAERILAIRDFRNIIESLASAVALFRAEAMEAVSGN